MKQQILITTLYHKQVAYCASENDASGHMICSRQNLTGASNNLHHQAISLGDFAMAEVASEELGILVLRPIVPMFYLGSLIKDMD
jgi:hypothetical protein